MSNNFTSRKKIWFFDLLIVFSILFLSYLPYLHVYVPDVPELEIFGLDVKIYFWETFLVWAYVASVRLVLMLLSSIWFITNNRWWGYGLLVPVSVLAYQFCTVISEGFNLKITNMELVLSSLAYSAVLIFIRYKLKYNSKSVMQKFYIHADNIFHIPFQKLSWVTRGGEKESDKDLNVLVAELEDINARFDKNREYNGNAFVKNKRNYRIVLFVLLITSPLFLYVFRLFPEEGNTVQIFGYDFTAESYLFVQAFVWLLFQKLYLVFFLSAWFLVERHWWKYAILLPISFGVFEAIEIAFPSPDGRINEDEYLLAFPVIILVIVILIFTSYKLKGYFEIGNYKELIESRITKLIAKISGFKKMHGFKMEFETIKRLKSELNEDEYLAALHLFKKKLLKAAKE
ncbi:hypothetical protein [Robertkochia aurantiaca]|uniref:hypothetical protein n=1 Tax=Robertkochia aurantiaca TaxID=2873700 RepID=UPI001CCD7F9A|nr:hypothetical protein [Robertkochia sp. 3YJGBD-33]